MSKSQRPDRLNGHHIVTEDELLDVSVQEEYSRAEEKARRRRHFRHGVVLVLVTVMLAVAAFAGWMVLTRQWVVPGLDSDSVAVVDDRCPVEEFAYADNNTVTVNVYNATGRAGLAAKVATQLRDRGFKIGVVANRRLTYDATIGVVISGGQGRSEALSVQRNVAGTKYVTDTRRRDETVDVILGSSFKSLTTRDKVRTNEGRLPCLPGTESSAPVAPSTFVPPSVSPSPSSSTP